MKKLSHLKITLLSLMATSLLAGCASELPLALNSSELNRASSFQSGQFGLSSSETMFAAGDFKPGHHRGGQGFEKGFGGFFGAELKLSEDQKSQLRALAEEERAFREENKPQTAPEDMKAVIDAAFTSDNFDLDALKAKIAETQPDMSALHTFEAEMLIKRYQILTSEQKATLKTKQAEQAAKMEELHIQPPEKIFRGGPGEKLAQVLNLSAEQISALEAVHKANAPAPSARAAQQAAIQAELEKSSPNLDTLAALLSQGRPGHDPDKKLAELKALHGILTAEQRQAFIDLERQMGRGPHGHQGMGPGKMGRRGHMQPHFSPEIQPPVY